MTDTEFPTARVIWKARAIGQDINDPGGIPEEIPLGGIKVDLIPSPKVIECTNGAGDPVTYRIKEWHLVTANNGELINYEDPTNGIEIVASDAFPGYVVSWKSIIEDPSGTLPPIIKKWLAPAGSIVDLTTVISVPNDPNPIADYLQAVYDAREARDNAISSSQAASSSASEAQTALMLANQARVSAENALAAIPGTITDQVNTQVVPKVTEATTAKNDAADSASAAAESAGQAQQYAQAAEDAADQALANAVGALPEWNATLGEYPAAQLELWLKRIRDGKSYGIEIPKGLATGCTKLGANAGIAVPIPGTNAVPAVDPYTQRGPFTYFEVNGFVDPDGSPHVTAIMGDGRFTRDGSNGDVWTLAPVLFWRWVNLADAVQLWVCDTELAGFTAQPKALLPSGAQRPFMLYAKYAMSIVNGTARSISNQPPASRNVSHNSLIAQCKNATTGYSGKSLADDWYTKAMFLLKYASKNSQSVFAGCTNHSQQYAPAVAESNVTRVLVTAAQAANFPVGSAIMLGTNLPTTTDRQLAQAYDVIATAMIASKEVVGSNTALNLNLAAPITTATTQLLSTALWWTGGCDGVVGDGSPISNSSGREPFVLQGIEMGIGINEVLGDVILNNTGSGCKILTLLDSKKAATSVTADYVDTGKSLFTDASDGWKYPIYPDSANGLLFGTGSGASSTTGMCDGTYTQPLTTTGLRELLSLGILSGTNISGLWYVSGGNVLGSTWWNIGSRLSANGRAS